ncbi:MAG: hypothetical protein O3C40_09610 [Planctomycetota bacterium]|nr:hypothetical protein [Planctomycetota bacterium]
MSRILNILLLLTIIAGVYFVTHASTKYNATRDEYTRLTAKVRRLPIEDAAKVHVLALETNDPLDFAWQVYTPPKFNSKWEITDFRNGSNSSSSMQHESQTEIFRVRFRKIDGQWVVWHKVKFSSRIESGALEPELLDRSEARHVQQLGVGKVRVVEPDEVVTMLSIMSNQLSQPGAKAKTAIVVRFGSQDAWAKQERKGE